MRLNTSIYPSLAAALCLCAQMAAAAPATSMNSTAMKAMPRLTAVPDQPVMCPAKLAAEPVAAAMPAHWRTGTWALVPFATALSSDATGQTLECDYHMAGSSGGAIVPLTARVPAGACVQQPDKQSFLCVRGVTLN